MVQFSIDAEEEEDEEGREDEVEEGEDFHTCLNSAQGLVWSPTEGETSNRYPQ